MLSCACWSEAVNPLESVKDSELLFASAGFSSELGDVISVLILLATRVAMIVASSSGQFLEGFVCRTREGEEKKCGC